jgi:hypothetical protein
LFQPEEAQQEWNDFVAPAYALADKALSYLEADHIEEGIIGCTAFITKLAIEHRVYTNLNTLYTNARHQAQHLLAQKFAPKLLKTADGAHIPIDQPGILKKSSPDPITSGSSKIGSFAESLAEDAPLVNYVPEGQGNLIKVFTNEVIKKYEPHIFSTNHIKDGILKLGDTQEAILEKALEIILNADKKGLLKNLDNQIELVMNGHLAHIRTHIINGEVKSLNIFTGSAQRKLGTTISWNQL